MTYTVLAFGDSLTWGKDPVADGRHRLEDRWPTVLAQGLLARGPGADTHMVAEGLGGRTTCFDDHAGAADRNGARILPILLGSHYPVDLLIIMLGTNDLKPYICGRAAGAAAGIERLIEIARSYPYGYGTTAPEILVVAPPIFAETEGGDRQPAGGRDIAESRRLAPAYAAVAKRRTCAFFDAATVAQSSPIDGVHLDANHTRAIGTALVPVVAALRRQRDATR